MATIENQDVWDLRDLAELAEECGYEIEDAENYDAEDVEDSKATLAKLADLAEDLNQSCDHYDADSVAAALRAASDNSVSPLIAESYFEDYVKQDMVELGYIPDELPWFISNNIDWSGVAEDVQSDYTNISFDGGDWLIR
jgi:hypothetical protein